MMKDNAISCYLFILITLSFVFSLLQRKDTERYLLDIDRRLCELEDSCGMISVGPDTVPMQLDSIR